MAVGYIQDLDMAVAQISELQVDVLGVVGAADHVVGRRLLTRRQGLLHDNVLLQQTQGTAAVIEVVGGEQGLKLGDVGFQRLTVIQHQGGLGLAEDKAEASIACRQVGPISFPKPLPRQAEVFNERISLVFKKLRVVRMVDVKRNTLVYLTYSEKLIDGSPQNSITAVPVDRATPIVLRP